MKKISLCFLLLLILALAACNGDSDDDVIQEDDEDINAPLYNLRPDVLVSVSGNWTLNPESVDFEQGETTLHLTANYEHRTASGVGNVDITVFQAPEAAQQAFNDTLAQWQSSPTNTVKKITAFADDAYTLNASQAGIALVTGDGFLLVEFDGDITDLDLLNLMQIGVDVLSAREPPREGGSLGEATLAPIDTSP